MECAYIHTAATFSAKWSGIRHLVSWAIQIVFLCKMRFVQHASFRRMRINHAVGTQPFRCSAVRLIVAPPNYKRRSIFQSIDEHALVHLSFLVTLITEA